MSYVLNIFRAPGKPPLTAEEWRSFIQSDSSLALESIPEQPGSACARWMAHPKQQLVLFTFADGRIATEARDDVIIRKAQEIARRLDARLQGEEGEFLEDVEMPSRGGCAATICFAVALLLSLIWLLSK